MKRIPLVIITVIFFLQFGIATPQVPINQQETDNEENFAPNIPPDISENMSSPCYEEITSVNRGKDTFENNIQINTQQQYRQNSNLAFIFNLINTATLNSVIPDGYTAFDSPSKDQAPINRFNAGLFMNRPVLSPNSDIVSMFLVDKVLRTLTNDVFSFNFNFIALGDNPNAINMDVTLTPIKDISFKFSVTEKDNRNLSAFEMKIKQDKNKNIKFKTTEDLKGTSTGVEFEFIF